ILVREKGRSENIQTPSIGAAAMASCHCDEEFMRRNQVLQDLLPAGYDFRVCSFESCDDGFVASIFMKITTKEGALEWLADFEQSSKTTWRKDKTYPRETGANLYRVDLRCQHNTKPKNELANLKLSSKNTNCPAKLNIVVKKSKMRNGRKSRSKHAHITNGYFMRVHLSFKHNHLIDSPDTYRKRDVNAETIDKLKQLYAAGHSPTSASDVIRFHLEDRFYDDYFMKSSDRAVNPDFGFCYRLYSKIYGHPYKAPDKENLLIELEETLKTYCTEHGVHPEQFAKVRITHDGETCLAICTPLMFRVHQKWDTSCEMVFVYSPPPASNVDRHAHKVFLLLTYSPLGALPLGVVVTTSDSVDTLIFAFDLYKSLLTDNDFYSRGESGPVLFITDNHEALRTALRNAWPTALLFLCVIHLLQGMRRWLWNGGATIGIDANARAEILYRLRDMLYPENDEQLDEIYAESVARWSHEYPRLVEQLRDIYDDRATWANNYSEPMMRIVKDKIFERLKQFNMIQLIDVITTRWDCDLKKRLIDAANKRLAPNPKYFPVDAEINEDAIIQVTNKIFKVPSFRKPGMIYDVDMEFGLCTCTIGSTGGPCKHQGIVMTKYGVKTFDSESEILRFEQQQFYEIATGDPDFVVNNDENVNERNHVDLKADFKSGNERSTGCESEDELSLVLESLDDVFKNIKQNVLRNPDVFLEPVRNFVKTYLEESPITALQLAETLAAPSSLTTTTTTNGESVGVRSVVKRRRVDSQREISISIGVTFNNEYDDGTVNSHAATMYNKVGPLHQRQEWKIKKKVCARYVFAKSTQNSEEVCACGHLRTAHSRKTLEKSCREDAKNDWSPENDTYNEPTDAYGEIEFIGFNQRIGKYCRVACDSRMDDMKSLLFDQWNLKTPNLIISVTGGARSFKMKPRLKEMFQRGLMKVASTTGAWIITGGNHSGVMKHVGEAVREYSITHTSKTQIVCIGIAPWGYVSNQSDLINPHGLWPAKYRMEANIQRRGEIPLDCNHTHFILVDNGTKNQAATEIQFRAELENFISTMKTNTGCDKVPIVCVLLEGGPGSLETVYRAINVGTPAVIVQGSGRMADLLAFAYSNSTEKKIDNEGITDTQCGSEIDKDLENVLLERLEMECPKHVRDKDLWKNKYLVFIKDCLNKRDMLTVFQVSENDSAGTSLSIDLAILKALLKANKNQMLDQLRLALAWNRVDIAQMEIFTDHKDIPPEQLEEVLQMALMLDRVDFVRLLLENGVNIHEFLTIERILNLYNHLPKNSLLYCLLSKCRQDEVVTLKAVGKLISELIGDFYKPLYLRDSRYDISVKTTAELITSKCELQTTSFRETDRPTSFDNPTRELFVWSVLLNRQKMANLFWEEGKDKIAAALTASKLLKSLKKRTDDSELKKTISTAALHFEELAIGVLNECYTDDSRKAQKLLTRRLNLYGNTTCLLLAVKANNKNFISHPCCQLLLNNIWMGDLDEETESWRICLCVVCPLFVMSRNVINFSEDQRSFNSLGDRYMSFFQAPVITFMYNCISYLMFLLLFTYVVLFDFSAHGPGVAEIVLTVWIGSFLAEEIRQLVTDESSHNAQLKLRSYVKNGWNILDMLGIGLFVATVALRYVENTETFTAARIILSFDLMMYFFRVLHIFYARKSLGPKLVMIGKMTIDLTYFVVILMVFVLAYGLASQAILYPNAPLNAEIVISVLRKSYFQMYGELFLEEIEGQDVCTSNRTLWMNGPLPRCPEYISTIIVPILLGMYILFTNVLMFNLLIAIFSYTFNRIQENTDRYWNFQRYFLIHEYRNRPPIPPPGVLICHVSIAVKSLVNFLRSSSREKSMKKMKRTTEDASDECKQLLLWENINCEEYLHRLRRNKNDSLENRLNETMKKVEQLSQRMYSIQEFAQTVKVGGGGKITDVTVNSVTPAANTSLSEFRLATDAKLDLIIQTLKNLGDEKRKRKKEKKRHAEQLEQLSENISSVRLQDTSAEQ
ncbi:transient receptor potential cation channel subfamily M member 8-like, partial [Tubulanus polymorphus]|uniref:transient receptor potential cation channel subfamily M member 8-like n=1 Tax=Tubulanus polymorphus TaxID=672921 RepID=UPI003DA24E4E